MPQSLTIEFDLNSDMARLRTPFSHAEFSDTETGRAMLFRALRANAQYQSRRNRAIELGETNLGKDVSDVIFAYDLKEIEKMMKRYDEKGKLILNVDELEIEF